MGEETELILNGTLCKLCGYLIEDLIPKEGKLLKAQPWLSTDMQEMQNSHREKHKKSP